MPRKQAIRHKLPQQRNLREKLGISQSDYAHFCGISKSLLGMIEIGQRSWPAGKTTADLPLHMAFLEAEQQPHDLSAVEKPPVSRIKVWQKRLREIRLEQYRQSNILEEMAFQLETCRRRWQTCQHLRQRYPELAAEQQLLLELWERKALRLMQNNSEEEQALLRFRLDCLNREQALLESFLENIPPPHAGNNIR